ncbi:MAG: GAF domain-containing protein [Candidatus Eremiobacteraeota bacterium]|nr:GAF domain-containing protein [Candidatus Eremiobacteraeota bacterium]
MSTDYPMLERQLISLLETERNFIANAANFAAFLYCEVEEVNWLGFYFLENDSSLVLGPFAGRPACTRLPKGRGVCGKAVTQARTLIVDDVSAFDDHIVCDSASASEIVIPIFSQGRIIGVLDIDAPIKNRFTAADAAGLERLVLRFIEHTNLPIP